MTTASVTKIASWGNSDAVRIPRALLRLVGLSSGDSVDIVVNERNNIEIVPKGRAHRRVKPARGVTFDSLFANYDSTEAKSALPPAWPNDDMVGAEFEAWSR